MTQPSGTDRPDPKTRRMIAREVAGGLLVLIGGITVVTMSVLLGGWLAAGLVAGLIAMVAGALLVSTAAPDVSEQQRPQW